MKDELLQVGWQYAVLKEHIERNKSQSVGWRNLLIVQGSDNLISHVLRLPVILVKPGGQTL